MHADRTILALLPLILGGCTAAAHPVDDSGGSSGKGDSDVGEFPGATYVDFEVHQVRFPEHPCETGGCYWDSFDFSSGAPELAVRVHRGFVPIAMTPYVEDEEDRELGKVDFGGQKAQYNYDDDANLTHYDPVTVSELAGDLDTEDFLQRKIWINVVEVDDQGPGTADLPEDGNHKNGDARYQEILASCPLVTDQQVRSRGSINLEEALKYDAWPWECDSEGHRFTAIFKLVPRDEEAPTRDMDGLTGTRIRIGEVHAPFSKDVDRCHPNNDESEHNNSRCVWDPDGEAGSNDWQPDMEVRLTVLKDKPRNDPFGWRGFDRAVPLDETFAAYAGSAATTGKPTMTARENGLGVWDFDDESLDVRGLTAGAMNEGRVFVEFLDNDGSDAELMNRCYFRPAGAEPEYGAYKRLPEGGFGFICAKTNGLGGAHVTMSFTRE